MQQLFEQAIGAMLSEKRAQLESISVPRQDKKSRRQLHKSPTFTKNVKAGLSQNNLTVTTTESNLGRAFDEVSYGSQAALTRSHRTRIGHKP